MTFRTALFGALTALVALIAAACGSADDEPIAASTPPAATETAPTRFTVTAVPDELAPLQSSFAKHTSVWGVHVVATADTPDETIVHAATVMAEYLDNDEDGTVDDPAVLESMVANRATLLMAATPDGLESLPDVDAVFDFVGTGGQDLYASETNQPGRFDASLEEVHHLILNTGWSQVHPGPLAQDRGSEVAAAMDLARGGTFDRVPDRYPEGAWYTYDDRTCDYRCQITEYTYWAHTTLLGLQEGRAGEIGNEWRPTTAAEVRAQDPAVVEILERTDLGLPTIGPDGSYTPAG